MDKQSIQTLVNVKSDRLTYCENEGKSAVWKHFLLISVDGSKVPFVKCNKCHTVLKWLSKDGTKSLNGHHVTCSAQSPTTRITDMPGFSAVGTKVPSTVKSSMANEIVSMCATDIRPFTIVDGPGFKRVAQKLIALGAQYGNIPADNVLPCATTVSRHLHNVVAERKADVIEKLRAVGNCGITTDGWTHTTTNHQYITITAHYIDKEWNVHSYILATRLADDQHTAHYIRNFVGDILAEFGLGIGEHIFVTDNAANMKSAFRNEVWVGCSGHNLNLVLSHGLQPSSAEEHHVLPAEVTTLINTCKELVTLSKRSCVNRHLETTLKQCVCTRWNSVLTMLQSVNDNKAKLRTVASDAKSNRNLFRLLSDLDDDLLQTVIAVLVPFESATKVLSADKTPTLHLVLPTRYKLLQHLTKSSADTAVIADLKQRLSQLVHKHFVVGEVHAAAALLDPRLKNKEGLISEELRNGGVKVLETMLTSAAAATSAAAEGSELEPPHKAPRLEAAASAAANDDFFEDLFAPSQPSGSCATVTDEIGTYMSTSNEVVTDVLSFWQQQQLLLPKLARVARVLLGVPATSTSSERSFSLAGRTLEDRRSTLCHESVDGLLFLHGL